MTKVMQYSTTVCPDGIPHWHDEGTGVYPEVKYAGWMGSSHFIANLGTTVALQWRQKPMNTDLSAAEFPTDGCMTKPNRGDADPNGFVQLLTDEGWELYHWSQVSGNKPWRHTIHWKGACTDEEVLADAQLALKGLRYVACVPSPTNQSDLDAIEVALERFRNKLC
ncbi:hypothetical protein SCRM01_277 [Synechococcus phage S-CRM01]|uniref:hypothetical protein n=1 Tax=Synechococcus phage S-CRM01 TaxID=1026955 RepID=UPI000209E311|nr:hypothetical protein SCRM01_277 [Synechococcus phage S-CRM01]AEC53223.1 hypothetical protein SCRM01_277 [Synechococcus phage S-CRM01]